MVFTLAKLIFLISKILNQLLHHVKFSRAIEFLVIIARSFGESYALFSRCCLKYFLTCVYRCQFFFVYHNMTKWGQQGTFYQRVYAKIKFQFRCRKRQWSL